jgi:hypothetical protein
MIGTKKLKKKKQQQRRKSLPESNKKLRGSSKNKSPSREGKLQSSALRLTGSISTESG